MTFADTVPPPPPPSPQIRGCYSSYMSFGRIFLPLIMEDGFEMQACWLHLNGLNDNKIYLEIVNILSDFHKIDPLAIILRGNHKYKHENLFNSVKNSVIN